MRNLLTLEYDNKEGIYSYSFSKDAPSNCELLVYDEFSSINVTKRCILFIGCIWYANLDVVSANALVDIAAEHLDNKFYFRIILDEKELKSLVPNELVFTHLPIILLLEDSKWKAISTGRIGKDELKSKIDHELGCAIINCLIKNYGNE